MKILPYLSEVTLNFTAFILTLLIKKYSKNDKE